MSFNCIKSKIRKKKHTFPELYISRIKLNVLNLNILDNKNMCTIR